MGKSDCAPVGGVYIKTGIVHREIFNPTKNIEYSEIIEIIDSEPKINSELLRLAEWIALYYKTYIGQVIFAMLPIALDVTVQEEIVIKQSIRYSENKFYNILNEIEKTDNFDIALLKKQLKIKNFHETLEELENEKLIEIKRTFDQKIKRKTINIVKINDITDLPNLTSKQLSAYKTMKTIGSEFPLKKISDTVSYSLVKALKNKRK